MELWCNPQDVISDIKLAFIEDWDLGLIFHRIKQAIYAAMMSRNNPCVKCSLNKNYPIKRWSI